MLWFQNLLKVEILLLMGMKLKSKKMEVWVCKAGEVFHGTSKVQGEKPRIMLSFGHHINKKLIK